MSHRRLALLTLPLLALAGLVTPTARAGLLGPSSADPAGGAFTLGGRPCRLIPVPVASPVGLPQSCPGVRPGAALLVPTDDDTFLCTQGFLLAGSDGASYVATAGHCILGDTVGERRWAAGTGPPALDATKTRIGEFAFAVLKDPMDIALVRLDPAAAAGASPQLCHFGGPTGINRDQTGSPTLLEHFGQGIGVGALLPGRTAVALGMPDPDVVSALGLALPGDSGSPVVTSDGEAVGVLVSVGIGTGGLGLSGADVGDVFVTRLAPQLTHASTKTGVTYTLRTAPSL
jgi:hypothetical protein